MTQVMISKLSWALYLLTGGILPLTALLSIRFYGATIGTVVTIILLFAIIFGSKLSKPLPKIDGKIFLQFTLLISWLCILVILHPSDLKQLLPYAFFFLSYVVATFIADPKSNNDFILFFKWLKRGAFVSFSIGIYQKASGLILLPPEMLIENPESFVTEDGVRGMGGMLSANGYGYFSALICALLTISFFHKRKSNSNSMIDILFILIAFTQLIASQSRSAILGYTIAMLIFFINEKNKDYYFKSSKKILFFAFFAILILFNSFIALYGIDALYYGTLNDLRWGLWFNAYIALQENPIILICGLGVSDSNRADLFFSDNLFIELILTGGFPLLILSLFIIFKPMPRKLINSNKNLFYINVISSWKVIFFFAALFSSAFAFQPFAIIFFIGLFMSLLKYKS